MSLCTGMLRACLPKTHQSTANGFGIANRGISSPARRPQTRRSRIQCQPCNFPCRILSQSPQKQNARCRHDSAGSTHRAFVALGSNMGDRVAMIEQACKEMEASGNIKIVRTSSLWETEAMYVLDQDKFVNGACEVSFMCIQGLQCLTCVDRNSSVTN